ncbi:MAG: thiamine pyrophosphate-binding protein [Methanobacteriaceae archaeon]|nr:thiamine pyrophosphate-binding protein [Methanobacteriaceae archaeon]MDP3623884.1 thiamine pyrophosphate-binding protein [Methanobacteriaceae archaeon]
MVKYQCTVCNYIYDDEIKEIPFSELPEDWRCPVCNASQKSFELLSLDSENDINKESISEDMDLGHSTVSHVMVNQMAEWGVEYVFGIPGTSSLGVLQGIKDSDSLKYYQVRHEQTAAFMASAYGKLTGKVAACLTVAGPGATNLSTGLYDAKLDHSPVLAITGQVKRQLIGPGSFQEIDQHSFFEPVSVFNKPIIHKDQTTLLTTLAIKEALIKKGVSHISIPNDVQKQKYETKLIPLNGKIPQTNLSPANELVEEAAETINSAQRPVIIAGFGAMDQGDILLEMAKKITSPIVTTFRGKGVVDEDEELCVGGHGTIGSSSASQLVKNSDLLIVIGSSYSDMTQIPPKRTIQIDKDPMMIGRKHSVEVGLLGDSSVILPALLDKLVFQNRLEYKEEIKLLKSEWSNLIKDEIDSSKSPIRPQYIMKVLNDKLSHDGIITLDVGENAWWFGRNFQMKKSQKMAMSGSLATMGFGLPAALSAQIAYPEKEVVCITGDGGFSMVMADFLTAVKYNLPIKVFLLNNNQLGMIQQEQKVEGYPNWQTELLNCNFASFAEICGGVGIKVTSPDELPQKVEEALGLDLPTIVDIQTDPRRFI